MLTGTALEDVIMQKIKDGFAAKIKRRKQASVSWIQFSNQIRRKIFRRIDSETRDLLENLV